MSPATVFADPALFLTQWRAKPHEADASARQFLAGSPARYALGRNEGTLQLAQEIPLEGILDDFADTSAPWHGLPVVSSEGLPADAMVVNMVAAIRPVSAERRLQSLGEGRWLNHADLLRLQPERFTPPDFVQSSRAAVAAEGGLFQALYRQLADDVSRATMLDVFRYRLTSDPAFMQRCSCRMKDQYFEPFYTVPDGCVFIDAGGYDGETSLEFATRHPHYGHIHVFEPSATNHATVISALQGLRHTHVHATGLSHQHETLRFSGEAGSASKITGEGSEAISVDRLDRLVPDRVDFIKMDLEGWELNALQGASDSIVRDHPILAISAYHHALDFVRIPALVLGLRKDYKIYLRHYTEGWSETVMYFVPIG